MNKIFLVLSFLLTAIVSGIVGAVYSKNYFVSIMEEKMEVGRLENIAYSQIILEKLDKKDLESAREEVDSAMTTLIFNLDPENVNTYRYSDACNLHTIVYLYRAKRPELYQAKNDDERTVQRILEMWNKRYCEE